MECSMPMAIKYINDFSLNISKLTCRAKIFKWVLLGQKCNLNNIIYQANISTKEGSTNEKAYIDITALNWKYRFYNHIQSLKYPTLKNQTVLSIYYWSLKEIGLTPIIDWKIIKRSLSVNNVLGRCNFMLRWKYLF